MAALGVIALAGVTLAVSQFGAHGLARGGEEIARARIHYGREAVQALLACVAVTILMSAALQFVPVSRPRNPYVQEPFTWDSTQTQELVTRACMNCHSNQTEWPVYATIAPASWIIAVHVTSARAQFNLSELTNLSTPRKVRLARDMID